jgi:hypothetical protein
MLAGAERRDHDDYANKEGPQERAIKSAASRLPLSDRVSIRQAGLEIA